MSGRQKVAAVLAVLALAAAYAALVAVYGLPPVVLLSRGLHAA